MQAILPSSAETAFCCTSMSRMSTASWRKPWRPETVLREPADQFYGDRAAIIVDPSGHHWSLNTHIRDVSPEEMAVALEAMAAE